MNASEILEQVRDTLTVRRVFGEPIERDGVLMVPVACVRGGFGGGAGEGQPKREGEKGPSGWGGGGGTGWCGGCGGFFFGLFLRECDGGSG